MRLVKTIKIVSLNIDIYRTILAQWVIIAHLGPALLSIPIVPGRVAVWSFFIISGYLNALSFQHRSNSGRWLEAVRGYYLARVKRIYPMLILSCFSISVILGTLIHKDWYVLFPYMYSQPGELSNGVLWTLVIEIQLYAVTPALFFVAYKFRDLHWILQGCTAVFLVFSIPAIHILLANNPDLIDDRTMLGNVGFYLFGMMMALGSGKRVEISRRMLKKAGFMLLVFGAIFLFQYNFMSQAVQFYEGQLLALLSSFLILVSVKPIVSKGHFLFRFLGYYTYEIYALHGLFVFIYHQLHLQGALWAISLWWLAPMLTVVIFDFIYKKKYRELQENRALVGSL